MEAAISKGCTKSVQQLLAKDKKKKLLQQKFINGQNALHIACDYENIDIVKLLLKHKADVNEKDDSLQTSLHIASKRGNISLISLLLPIANVNAITFQGNSPLHMIGNSNISNVFDCYTILESMKASGADLQSRNHHGNTPLHCAILKRSETLATWLVHQGVDVEIKNAKEETALHYAARYGSEKLISLLLSVGASPQRISQSGTPIEHAKKAQRNPAIISLLEGSKDSRYDRERKIDASISINGVDMNLEKLLHYQAIIRKNKLLFNENASRYSTAAVKRNEILGLALDINIAFLVTSSNGELLAESERWTGVIRFPLDDGSWVSEYSYMDDEKLASFNNAFEPVLFEGISSFRIYENNFTQFSILYSSTSVDDISLFSYLYSTGTNSSLGHFASKAPLVPEILQILTQRTNKSIEYVDETPLLTMLRNLDNNDEPPSRRKGSKGKKLQRATSAKILGLGSPALKKTLAKNNIRKECSLTDFKGTIHTSFDFSLAEYSSIFSSKLRMKPTTNNRFTINSGSLGDILHYLILHSGTSEFAGNIESKAFYMCYYRHCSPEQLINELKTIWETHLHCAAWPPSYKDFLPGDRLFTFLKGFIKSPFVHVDDEIEFQFRESLVELFHELVPYPMSETKTQSHLRAAFEEVKRAKLLAAATVNCDLTALLEESEEKAIPFNVTALEADVIVSQIIRLNADLYKKLRVSELLDLRYQKDKTFAASLTKVHQFSNQIYLLVPKTILERDSPAEQIAVLKQWIVIGEKLFELRDYNTTIQISNGIKESSVRRLSHLKAGLSPKWLERQKKLKSYFKTNNSFAAYRKLPKTGPCIPFLGVALKDLVFASEGNPDEVDNAINFQKMRMITDIVHSLNIEQPRQNDYSFLSFDPCVAKGLVNATPWTQDELFDRSKEISKKIQEEAEQKPDEIMELRRHNNFLENELIKAKKQIEFLNMEMKQKDEQIETLQSSKA